MPSRGWMLILVLLMVSMTACTAAKVMRQLNEYEITLASTSPVDTTKTDVTATTDANGKPAQLLSAFFGLDNGFPGISDQAICEGAGGKDGMPVIFSHEVDLSTMQAGDFKVTTASGQVGKLLCVTLAPADDAGELRTVLLVGEYGSKDDPPATVEVVGNLLSIDGSVNFKGASVKAIPLQDGPTMILAQTLPKERLALGKKATALPWGGGSGCPVGTRQVVNVTWVGGVTKPGGDEVDDVERQLYKVTVEQADGSQIQATPFALGDLGDGDNNHRLCLDVEGAPKSVSFPGGHMTDPNEDLNPDTSIDVTQP